MSFVSTMGVDTPTIPKETRGKKGWEVYLNNPSATIQKTSKTKKLIRKYGIPDSIRPRVWLAISGAKEKMAENQPMYKKLCEIVTAAPNPSVDMQQIEKDLERTSIGGVNIDKESLRRVLGAYKDILPDDYYSATMIGVQSDILVLKNVLARKFPKIVTHFESLQVRIDGVVLRWFLCLFVGLLPLEASKRVLDLFLFEGGKALFRVCVALFKIYEKTLLSTSDFDTIIDLLLNMPVNVPAGSLIEALATVDIVTQHQLNTLRLSSLESIRKDCVLDMSDDSSSSTSSPSATSSPSSTPTSTPAASPRRPSSQSSSSTSSDAPLPSPPSPSITPSAFPPTRTPTPPTPPALRSHSSSRWSGQENRDEYLEKILAALPSAPPPPGTRPSRDPHRPSRSSLLLNGSPLPPPTAQSLQVTPLSQTHSFLSRSNSSFFATYAAANRASGGAFPYPRDSQGPLYSISMQRAKSEEEVHSQKWKNRRSRVDLLSGSSSVYPPPPNSSFHATHSASALDDDEETSSLGDSELVDVDSTTTDSDTPTYNTIQSTTDTFNTTTETYNSDVESDLYETIDETAKIQIHYYDNESHLTNRTTSSSDSSVFALAKKWTCSTQNRRRRGPMLRNVDLYTLSKTNQNNNNNNNNIQLNSMETAPHT